MASGYHSSSTDFAYNVVGLDDATVWPADIWPAQQRAHQHPSRFDDASGMPRSMQRDIAGMDLTLTNDVDLGPTGGITSLNGNITTFNDSDCYFFPVVMTRTTSDISGYRSASIPNQLRVSSHNDVNRKRNFHQTDTDFSSSYPTSPAPWPSAVDNVARQNRLDNIKMYEPGDYCSKLTNEAGAVHFAAKKQRVEGFDASRPCASSSISAAHMCVPSVPEVAPCASMLASMSTHLSPCSLTSSEQMSRHSSVSSTSVTDVFDMMRVESSFSTASDLFPFGQIDGSFISCVREKPASRQSTTGLNNGSASHSFSAVGYVSTNPFSFHSHNLPAAAAAPLVSGQQSLQNAEDELCTPERNASILASVEIKASGRRSKHIENSRKSIAPRNTPQGQTSHSTARKYCKQNLGNKTLNLPTALKPKEAISKTPYLRPQHPKLYCNMCEDSAGFRGEHELRRHWDREHAHTRKVWICIEPTTRTDWWPAKPLSSCKQCKQQKQYNVYYNAAAHLRRAHFCPRKRGRKAKGEERESRAGKAGGDWPPIDWLKAHGWLKEIEVSSVQKSTSAGASLDGLTGAVKPETPSEESLSPPAASTAERELFPSHFLPSTGHALEQPTMNWHDFNYPITMKDKPCLPSAAAVSFHAAKGYVY